MIAKLPGRLQYQAGLDIKPCDNDLQKAFGNLQKTVRSWVTSRNEKAKSELGTYRYYIGGNFNVGRSAKINTESLRDEAGNYQAWAFRWVHPCASEEGREWRTDIGLQIKEDKIHFRIANYFGTRIGFHGEEPPVPTSSTPTVVKWVLKSFDWDVFIGNEQIKARSKRIEVNEAAIFAKDLIDPKREVPIVYISLEYEQKIPLLSNEELAKKLYGVAHVYYAADSDVDKILKEELPPSYRCWGGKVRVYYPYPDINNPRDSRRHRYYESQELKENPERVENIIIRSIMRGHHFFDRDAVGNIDHLHRLKNRKKLALFKERSAEDRSPNETAKDLSDLYEIVDQLEEELDSLKNHLQEKTQECDELESCLETERNKNESISNNLKWVEEEKEGFSRKVSELKNAQDFRYNFRELPVDLATMIQLVVGLFPDRLVFLPEAIKSAKNAGINKEKDIAKCWPVFHALPTSLYDVIFGDSNDKESAFKNASGYELSMTEGKETKRNKNMIDQRRFNYNGTKEDFTPHVKFSLRKEYLRIHFFPSIKEKKIVIGHCGDHLDTAGTRKKK